MSEITRHTIALDHKCDGKLANIIDKHQKYIEIYDFPAVFSIFVVDDQKYIYHRMFGKYTNSKRYLPSIPSLKNLFTHGVSPFEIYHGRTDLLEPFDTKLFKYIIANFHMITFCEVLLIYHSWYQQVYPSFHINLQEYLHHTLPTDLITIITDYCIHNQIYHHISQHQTVEKFIQNHYLPLHIQSYHLSLLQSIIELPLEFVDNYFLISFNINEGHYFPMRIVLRILASIRDKLLNIQEGEYRQKLSMKMCKSKVLLDICDPNAKYKKRFWPRGLTHGRAGAKCILCILDLARRFQWNTIEKKWNVSLSNLDVIIQNVSCINLCTYYILRRKYAYNNVDPILQFINTQQYYDLINHWIEMVQDNEQYFDECSVFRMQQLLIVLFMNLDGDNTSFFNNIDGFIKHLYHKILLQKAWKDIDLGEYKESDKFHRNILKYHIYEKYHND